MTILFIFLGVLVYFAIGLIGFILVSIFYNGYSINGVVGMAVLIFFFWPSFLVVLPIYYFVYWICNMAENFYNYLQKFRK